MDDERKRRAGKLVARLAAALCEYHGEKSGDLACHAQAIGILIDGFPGAMNGFEPMDFIRITVSKPGKPPYSLTGRDTGREAAAAS